MNTFLLGIESSCDDTSAAVIHDTYLLSNIISSQDIHKAYGGVVPELASRAHQQNIIPVVDMAIKKAGISLSEINGIAFTRGPGLLGSLLVGTSFSKGLALSLKIPLIEVNHLQGHIASNFIRTENNPITEPEFPFLCLLVSGGHSEIILVRSHLKMEKIGRTIDDAAGEAFDKCGKIMGLPYPAGPHIDRLAAEGDPDSFVFNKPKIKNLDYSFSGLKTSFLYYLKKELKTDKRFISKNINNLCASLQKTIIDILLDKLKIAAKLNSINEICLAGGVSANSGLRKVFKLMAEENKWNIYIPPLEYTTDNAAMIAIAGYYKYLNNDFASQDITPSARLKI
ncbi:tRNA (adenosine(37)-N6)-threonylcarbamoyltransferase complex transferase subunit TsaD [Bacteroidota bacterium]